MKLYTVEDIKGMKSITSAYKQLLNQAQQIELNAVTHLTNTGEVKDLTPHEISVKLLCDAFSQAVNDGNIKLFKTTINDILTIAISAAKFRNIELI